MRLIAELIENKRKDISLDEGTLLFLAQKVVEGEFGKVGRENIYPEKIVSKTLILKSSGSLWASEVWLRRHVLLSNLNNEAGEVVVERLKVS